MYLESIYLKWLSAFCYVENKLLYMVKLYPNTPQLNAVDISSVLWEANMILCYRVSATMSSLANKEISLLSVARICIRVSRPEGATMPLLNSLPWSLQNATPVNDYSGYTTLFFRPSSSLSSVVPVLSRISFMP